MRSRVSIIGIRRRGNFRLAERDQNRAMPNTLPKNSDSRTTLAEQKLRGMPAGWLCRYIGSVAVPVKTPSDLVDVEERELQRWIRARQGAKVARVRKRR